MLSEGSCEQPQCRQDWAPWQLLGASRAELGQWLFHQRARHCLTKARSKWCPKSVQEIQMSIQEQQETAFETGTPLRCSSHFGD